MNAFQLHKPDGTPVPVWACGECGLLYATRTRIPEQLQPLSERLATECCTNGTCRDCGTEKAAKDKHYTHCAACRQVRDQQRYEEQMSAAQKLDTWDGWVYWDDVGPNDGFFHSLDDLLEWHADEENPPALPEFVFCCKTIPFRKVHASDVIEWCTEDSFEDAADQIDGEKELAVALEAFNAANVGLVSYQPDYSKAARIT